MGLDISVKLVVGVPIEELGNLSEETRMVDLYSPTGKKTGGKVALIEAFLDVGGERHPVGSNEASVSESGRSGAVEYYDGILSTESSDALRAHWSDYRNVKTVVMGIEVAGVAGPELNRYESLSACTYIQVQELLSLAMAELDSRFGYRGKVYVIAIATYSY